MGNALNPSSHEEQLGAIMSTNIYTSGIIRVADKATKLGIGLPHDAWHQFGTFESNISNTAEIPVTRTKFGRAIMDCVEDPNIRYVFRIVDSKINPPDWHYIEHFDESTISRYDTIEGARSLEFALAHVREQFELEDLICEEVEDSETVSFLCDGVLYARVSRMVFHHAPNAKLTTRISKGLKHLSSGKTAGEINSLMANLLGCQLTSEISTEKVEPGGDRMDYVVCSSLNNLSYSMKKAFKFLNIDISIGHAHELISAFFGYTSWNAFSVLEKQADSISINPSVVSRYDISPAQHLFFQTEADSLAYYQSIINLDSDFEARVNSTYGRFSVRQPPSTYDPVNWIYSTELEDRAFVCNSVYQVDRYELDSTSPVGRLGMQL